MIRSKAASYCGTQFPVPRQKQYDIARFSGASIEADLAEASEGYGVVLSGPSGIARTQRAQENRHGETPDLDHFRSTLRTPPEINAVTSSSAPAMARPSGAARYRGRHTGSNFSLYLRSPSKL